MRVELMGESEVLPVRRARVLIEDPHLAGDEVQHIDCGPVEVLVCSGPQARGEVCPLVADGACPLGSVDAVVSSLDGPWAAPVAAAWAEAGVRVIDGLGSDEDPCDRVRHAVGAALAAAHGPLGEALEPTDV